MAYHIWFTRVLYLCQYGLTLAEPHGCMKISRRGALCLSDLFPFYEALGHVGTGACTERMQLASGTKKGTTQRKEASTRQAPKRLGGKGVAITHGPRVSEPECTLHWQFVATHHQKYEAHTFQEQ